MPISSYTTKEINQPVAFTEQRNGCLRVFGVTYGSRAIANVQLSQGKAMHGWNWRYFIFLQVALCLRITTLYDTINLFSVVLFFSVNDYCVKERIECCRIHTYSYMCICTQLYILQHFLFSCTRILPPKHQQSYCSIT